MGKLMTVGDCCSFLASRGIQTSMLSEHLFSNAENLKQLTDELDELRGVVEKQNVQLNELTRENKQLKRLVPNNNPIFKR